MGHGKTESLASASIMFGHEGFRDFGPKDGSNNDRIPMIKGDFCGSLHQNGWVELLKISTLEIQKALTLEQRTEDQLLWSVTFLKSA